MGLQQAAHAAKLRPGRARARPYSSEADNLDSPPQYKQLAAVEKAAHKLFPLGKRRDGQPWKGAQMKDGEKTAVDMAPFRANRF